ncbi:C5a anaphylatoxin chemotactic receptor 1 [Myiozetetes cayanensis]|uniref:C5a anaphylatoxin chemotactic receptor 1 n=1 Tax=Myiozetetes cayanensis TaxID=478635 RepID=UPI00215E9AE5|nr:C5a anaphylatoxin chemotactic receptor 1 [Myiozetetes cayanensis]
MGLEIPKMRMDIPKMGLETPKMRMDTPKMRLETPKMRMDTPKMGMETPKMRTDAPKTGPETPKMWLETPPKLDPPHPSPSPSHSPTRHDPPPDYSYNSSWDDSSIYELDAPSVPLGLRLVLALYALIFVLGVLGNGAVLWVTALELRRTVNGVWFLNLALADLLCCLALPFLALPLALDHHWPLGGFCCRALPSLTVLNMFASVLLLTALSADRCALVTHPVWCHNHRTPALARGACAGAWGAAALLTLPSFVFRTARRDPFSAKTTCVLDYSWLGPHGRRAEVGTAVLRLLCGFAGPLVVISACYGRLLLRLRSRGGPRRPRRATATVLAVVGAFFACWLPYHALGLVLAAAPAGSAAFQAARDADPLVAGLAYVNSCLNPIIYAAAGRGFRRRARRSWRGVLRAVLGDETPTGDGNSRSKSGTTTVEEQSVGTDV